MKIHINFSVIINMSKSISINPEFFKLSGRISKKKKKQKPKFNAKSLKPNDIKKKLIAKIKAHQKKEKERLQQENEKKESFGSDFKETISYLEEIKKNNIRKKKKKQKNKTLKRRKDPAINIETHTKLTPQQNNNKPNSSSGIQIHLGSMDDKPINDVKNFNNNSISNIDIAKDPPYGCLKNGSKPTWRQYNKTLKKEKTVDNKPLFDLSLDLPKHKEFIERQKKLQEIKNKLSTPKPKPKKRKIQTKRIRRKITLGKIGNKIGVLVKSKKTRKIIKNEVNVLKKKSIHDIKDYLRRHNLIKIGSSAPDYILRSIYENAFLSGEIKNKNADVLLHNWHKEEEQ